jgi:pimeloyl-ACP methyl ester carboxylesterase
MIQTTNQYLKFRDWDIFLRNKKRSGATVKILYCMGATYHTNAYFDMPINGVSAMDYLANAGFDVYCYDMLGMGRSSKPAANDSRLENFDTFDGLSVVERVYDHVAADGVAPHVIGYSWGSIVTLMLANKRSIPSLTLLGARYPTPELVARNLSIDSIAEIYPYSTDPGFYRVAKTDDIRVEWQANFSDADFANIVSPDVVNSFVAEMLVTESNEELRELGNFYSPRFTKNDVKHFIFGKINFAQARNVKCPCLIQCAPDEKEMSEELHRQLLGKKEYHLIDNSTHWGLIENNRFLMLNNIVNFINNGL